MRPIIPPLSIAIFLVAFCLILFSKSFAATAEDPAVGSPPAPNIVFILTDDHRWDSYNASGIARINTPNLDSIAIAGTRFKNAFVTLAICSPSRAACLTGRYGSANGVTAYGKVPLNEGEKTFAHALREAGYATGVAGKWHLKTSPEGCGFDFASTCWSNGTWYNRKFTIDGKTKPMNGFVDDVAANESIRFINKAIAEGKPFALWMCTQVPHMDSKHTWPAEEKYLDRYRVDDMPVPDSWDDLLNGKPPYLKSARNRTRAIEYGYDESTNIQLHTRNYRASVEQMDAAVGRVLAEIKRKGLQDNTWVIFMGDNGWMLGEHGMTSKVLPYEESMRVPMAISGPKSLPQVCDEIVLNVDLYATICELAGIEAPNKTHGRSLYPILQGNTPADWRTSFLYEAPESQLGSQPLWAVRNKKWKYIETAVPQDPGQPFIELYDLESDSGELFNLASTPKHRETAAMLANELSRHKESLLAQQSSSSRSANAIAAFNPTKPEQAEKESLRTDIHISGVYPHLTTYGVYSQNGAHEITGHNECGIGAIVPWAGKLWMVNYAPHRPQGSEHKLFSVSPDFTQPVTVHPESVGGTPAGRMIHAESNQLLIAHHLIDDKGNVRTISPQDMPIRVTAIARHLTDPTNRVYYIDMEGSIWEANVHSLEVKRLFKKPVPGWHGKGGYTSQGRLIVSNNGELAVGKYDALMAGSKAHSPEERGVLAEFDGTNWKIVERRQFTEVTGPNGITGGSDGDDPVWSVGWDRRSLRLKLLDKGNWHTYLLPKAAYCNDAKHGWYTEWPRIREVTQGRWMMDMHGMFFDFPKTFSHSNSAGIKPIGSHLRYVPDFCDWNGKLVLATDETSIQGNPLAGQPQSNLWFGSYDELSGWGPASGYGGPWIEDEIKANTPSDPFLISGFDQRFLHLSIGRRPRPAKIFRTTDQLPIKSLPDTLATLPRVTTRRGAWRSPASGFEFSIDQPAKIYLAVDGRCEASLPADWKATELSLTWGKNVKDRIFVREFPVGQVQIPKNDVEHAQGAFGLPHIAFVQMNDAQPGSISSVDGSSVAFAKPNSANPAEKSSSPVRVKLQIDRKGDGTWSDWESIEISAGGYVGKSIPENLDAVWLRLVTDSDCVATAFIHQTTKRFIDGNTADNKKRFQGLANADDETALNSRIYPAKRNRNLRVITGDDKFFDFMKSNFTFVADEYDAALDDKLKVKQEFSIDAASVIVEHDGKRLRLPKGNARFGRPFTSGWPRAIREVESERLLANIHGTFYELPLVTNGAPPAWNLVRPVSSHCKQITDFCSWNGLLVLSGIRANAPADPHIFRSSKNEAALWFGGIDDLWKLGKPVGHGGPWANTEVKSGEASDPYLMKGYDQKTASMSHSSAQPVSVTLEIDLDGTGLWVKYKTFVIPPNATVEHEFASDFSACWIRATSDQDTTASLQFEYR